MKHRVYRGVRNSEGCTVTVKEIGQRLDWPLDPRLDIRTHSSNGFEWGYSGSGPAQLALAILADHLDDKEEALRLYQDFKRLVIIPLELNTWTLTSIEVASKLDVVRWRQRKSA